MESYKIGLAVIFTAAIASCSTTKPEVESAASDSAGKPANAASQVAASPGTPSDMNRIVCKKVVPTGSRLGTKTCKTARQWKIIQQKAQESVQRSTRKSGHQNREGS